MPSCTIDECATGSLHATDTPRQDDEEPPSSSYQLLPVLNSQETLPGLTAHDSVLHAAGNPLGVTLAVARSDDYPASAKPTRASGSARPRRKASTLRRTATPLDEAAERTTAFRRRFFPEAKDSEWNDWRWQSRHRIRTLDQLERMLVLSDDERRGAQSKAGSMLPVGITPYYMSLLDRDDPQQPLRRTVIPTTAEFVRTPGEADDPLGEDGHSPVAGPGPSLSRPRAAAGARLLLDLLPLLHAVARGRARRDHARAKPRLEKAFDYIRAARRRSATC